MAGILREAQNVPVEIVMAAEAQSIQRCLALDGATAGGAGAGAGRGGACTHTEMIGGPYDPATAGEAESSAVGVERGHGVKSEIQRETRAERGLEVEKETGAEMIRPRTVGEKKRMPRTPNQGAKAETER